MGLLVLPDLDLLLPSHHTNMNAMWGGMEERGREEYKQFFVAYHDRVAR